MSSFSDRLVEAVRRCCNPVLVGLDPRWESLPESIRSGVSSRPADRADAFRRFCFEVIDVVAGRVPAVKPQAAFFEQLGPAGFAALGEVVAYAKDRGLLVILDGKRNDIGSTAAAYADGWLGHSPDFPWRADALTVSPYLGDDSLRPFFETAQQRSAGVFVLVKTSNPGGGMFQDLLIEGRPLYCYVADYVEQQAKATRGAEGYGLVGAVVGATYPEQLAQLRQHMPHAWILIPGYGSLGGTARDCAAGFDDRGLGALVNNSRGIIFAYERKPYCKRFDPLQWQRAVEAATDDMIAQLREHTSAVALCGPAEK